MEKQQNVNPEKGQVLSEVSKVINESENKIAKLCSVYYKKPEKENDIKYVGRIKRYKNLNSAMNDDEFTEDLKEML